MGHVGRLQLRGELPLPLVPAVLEPRLHLRLRQLQTGGQTRALRAAQVAFHVKGGLQLVHLAARENRASLLLGRVAALLVPAFPDLPLLGQRRHLAAWSLLLLFVILQRILGQVMVRPPRGAVRHGEQSLWGT